MVDVKFVGALNVMREDDGTKQIAVTGLYNALKVATIGWCIEKWLCF